MFVAGYLKFCANFVPQSTKAQEQGYTKDSHLLIMKSQDQISAIKIMLDHLILFLSKETLD